MQIVEAFQPDKGLEISSPVLLLAVCYAPKLLGCLSYFIEIMMMIAALARDEHMR